MSDGSTRSGSSHTCPAGLALMADSANEVSARDYDSPDVD